MPRQSHADTLAKHYNWEKASPPPETVLCYKRSNDAYEATLTYRLETADRKIARLHLASPAVQEEPAVSLDQVVESVKNLGFKETQDDAPHNRISWSGERTTTRPEFDRLLRKLAEELDKVPSYSSS